MNLPALRDVQRLGHYTILEFHDASNDQIHLVQRYRRESSEFAAPKTRRLHVKVESLMQLIFMKLDQDHSMPDYVYSEDRFRKRLAIIDGKLGP